MTGALAAVIFFALGSQIAMNSEPSLREAVRRSPGSFEASHRLGEFLLARDRIVEAIPHLEAAYQADPSHDSNTYDLALAYLRSGATEQASRHVDAALARHETASLRNLQGAIEAKHENVPAAAEAFRRAVELDPSEPYVFDLGEHFQRYRGFADAVKIFAYGLDRHPRSARLHVGLGIARYSLGEYDAAIEALCRAVDLNPADPRPLTFLGAMHDVAPALADEVRQRLEGFVKRFPQNSQAHYFYALSLWKRHTDRADGAGILAAEKHLRTAIAQDPKFAAAHFQLGVLLEDSQRPAQAIAAYNNAVRLDSSHLKAHYRLAHLYARAGNKAASVRHRQSFQRLQAAESK